MTLVGDILPGFGFTVTSNTTGDLTAPVSFSVALTAPDGTAPAVTVTNPSTGVYAVTYIPTQAGRYRATGTASGNGTDGVSELVWDVDDVNETLIGVDELAAYLKETRDSQADAIAAVLEAATAAVENYTGRTWRRASFTETHDGGRVALRLRHYPPLSVTAVTEDNAATTNWTLNTTTGLLHKGTSDSDTWVAKPNAVTVSYMAGATSGPQPVIEAIRQTARALWGEQTGGAPRQTDEYALPADVIPRMARMLLDPYRIPAF